MGDWGEVTNLESVIVLDDVAGDTCTQFIQYLQIATRYSKMRW